MKKLKIVKEQKGNDTVTRTIRISGATFDKINALAEKNKISFNIVPTYFHTDDKHKRKATSEVDKQYENEIPPATDDEKALKNSNIIQFPFRKAVNQ